jgi:hypothetical protein
MGLTSRFVVMALCYLQPLIRSWARYRTRLFSYGYPMPARAADDNRAIGVTLRGRCALAYWSELGHDRTELLGVWLAYLIEYRWGTIIDSGWSDWDIEVHYHPWTFLQIATAQEDHDSGKRLIRVRYRMGVTDLAKIVALLSLMAAAAIAGLHPVASVAALGLCLLLGIGAWWRGTRLASQAAQACDHLARQMNLIPCTSTK